MDLADAAFATRDVTTFARLDTLGLPVNGQLLGPDRAVLTCSVVDGDDRYGRVRRARPPTGFVRAIMSPRSARHHRPLTARFAAS